MASNSTSTSAPSVKKHETTGRKRQPPNVADLAPLYEAVGETLGVMQDQVMYDQQRRIEQQTCMLKEAKTLKVTGPGGVPVYAQASVDTNGFPSCNNAFWSLFFTDYPTKTVSFSALRDLEIYLGGIRLASSTGTDAYADLRTEPDDKKECFCAVFKNLRNEKITIWFGLNGGSLARDTPQVGLFLNEKGCLKETTTVTFVAAVIDKATVKNLLTSPICGSLPIDDDGWATSHRLLAQCAREAVFSLHGTTQSVSKNHEDNQLRCKSPATIELLNRQSFVVRDGLLLSRLHLTTNLVQPIISYSVLLGLPSKAIMSVSERNLKLAAVAYDLARTAAAEKTSTKNRTARTTRR